MVLANHHLFFADLALRAHWPEAQVLPPYEVVIFDEAHQIEEVATEFFGLHVSSQRLFALARDLGRTGDARAGRRRGWARSPGGCRWPPTPSPAAVRDRLPAPRPGLDEVRVPIPEDLWAARGSASPVARYHELDTVLEEAERLFAGLALGPDAPRLGVGAGDRRPLGGRGGRVRRAVAPGGRPARRAGRHGRRRGPRRQPQPRALGGGDRAQPQPARLPRTRGARCWPPPSRRTPGPSCSPRPRSPRGQPDRGSATCASGWAWTIDAAEAVFSSPFRFEQQALLYLACDLPDPGSDSFAAAAAARLAELCALSRGRALLLHTSFRNLRVTEAHFRRAGAFPLLVQGERPRHVLLRELREKVGSVLLATQSFWEGVDVPGEALSLVAMDKLPFAVPDDPLTAARITSIREEGGDPFASYQLPGAGLALKQGFGRLIRTRRDRGVVAILDGRIARRHYGATLLEALPRACPRTESLEEVAAFFAER